MNKEIRRKNNVLELERKKCLGTSQELQTQTAEREGKLAGISEPQVTDLEQKDPYIMQLSGINGKNIDFAVETE